jgi:hypothetical protein
MAALAETVPDVADDRLAARNAVVLAVAQAWRLAESLARCSRPIPRSRRFRSVSWQ